jgi:hypothetical protein
MTSRKILLSATLLVLLACSGQNLSDTGTTTINLEQDLQEVVTTDCNNNVVSDQIQTVAAPTQLVTISPKNSANIANSNFENTTTWSTAPWIINYNSFYVDYGDGVLTMHVVSGINTISYTFYNCDQWNSSGTCTDASTLEEQGTLAINVNYVEKTLPGVQYVSNCPSPSPTPAPTP